MLALTLTGCSGKNNSSDNSGSSNTASGAGADTSDSAASGNSGTGETANSETSGADSGDNQSGTSGRAAIMGAAAMNAVEWPSMMEIEDEETAQMFLGIDLNMCEDYYFSTQLISAQLNEIVIAKPAAGSEDALKEAFDAHFEYIQTDAAFYPEQEVSAAGAVSGTTEDGYYYIIVHENGEDAAAALLAAD